jgi:hypothetical protein
MSTWQKIFRPGTSSPFHQSCPEINYKKGVKIPESLNVLVFVYSLEKIDHLFFVDAFEIANVKIDT